MDEQAIGAKIVRVLRGGQVTLPIEFREALGIDENTALSVVLTADGALLVRPLRVSGKGSSEGSPWLKELYELFAPVRQEAIDKGYTGEQIDQWIDEAVADVRRERRLKAEQSGESDQRGVEARRAG